MGFYSTRILLIVPVNPTSPYKEPLNHTWFAFLPSGYTPRRLPFTVQGPTPLDVNAVVFVG